MREAEKQLVGQHAQQGGEALFEVVSIYNKIEETVLLHKLAGLETFGQILANGFFYLSLIHI